MDRKEIFNIDARFTGCHDGENDGQFWEKSGNGVHG